MTSGNVQSQALGAEVLGKRLQNKSVIEKKWVRVVGETWGGTGSTVGGGGGGGALARLPSV